MLPHVNWGFGFCGVAPETSQSGLEAIWCRDSFVVVTLDRDLEVPASNLHSATMCLGDLGLDALRPTYLTGLLSTTQGEKALRSMP